jgi:hypothetical protein
MIQPLMETQQQANEPSDNINVYTKEEQLANILARSHQWHCWDNCMCDKCKEYGIGIYFTAANNDW